MKGFSVATRERKKEQECNGSRKPTKPGKPTKPDIQVVRTQLQKVTKELERKNLQYALADLKWRAYVLRQENEKKSKKATDLENQLSQVEKNLAEKEQKITAVQESMRRLT